MSMQLKEALEKAKETSFNGRCLIEEFVEGEEFTVDMLGDAYGNVNCYGSSIQHHSLYALKNHVDAIIMWDNTVFDAFKFIHKHNSSIKCILDVSIASRSYMKKIYEKDIEISGMHIKNVKAIVISSQNAPLLLGQTAIQKLGRISLNGDKLIINDFEGDYSDEELDEILDQAFNDYKNKNYHASMEGW